MEVFSLAHNGNFLSPLVLIVRFRYIVYIYRINLVFRVHCAFNKLITKHTKTN